MFSSLKKELSSAASSIKKEVGQAADMAEDAWGESYAVMKNQLKTGNVVQLVSVLNNKTLHIVAAPTGQLVVEGKGGEGAQFHNACWTVHHEGGNRIKLFNQTNYLAIHNGTTMVVSYPPPAQPGPETTLRVIQRQTNIICLQAFTGPKAHIGIMPDGQLKSGVATTQGTDGQWGIRVISQAVKVNPAQQTVVVQQQQAAAAPPPAQQPAPYGAPPPANAPPYGAQGQQQHTVHVVNARPGQQIVIQQGQQAQQLPPKH